MDVILWGTNFSLLRPGVSQSSELHTTSGEWLETPAIPPCVVTEVTSKDQSQGEGPTARLPVDDRPLVLCAREFDADGMLRILGRRLKAAGRRPIYSLFWAAGFSFSRATLLQEVIPCMHMICLTISCIEVRRRDSPSCHVFPASVMRTAASDQCDAVNCMLNGEKLHLLLAVCTDSDEELNINRCHMRTCHSCSLERSSSCLRGCTRRASIPLHPLRQSSSMRGSAPSGHIPSSVTLYRQVISPNGLMSA